NHLARLGAPRDQGAAVFLATKSPAFALNAAARPGLPAYYDLSRALAADTGAGLIDDAPRWLARGEDWLRAALPDGLHPTGDAMAAVTGASFAAALAPLVCVTPPATGPAPMVQP
ncbi:MAG: hypothetical protein ACK5MQ_04680, partial [Pikeienuella sp.]